MSEDTCLVFDATIYSCLFKLNWEGQRIDVNSDESKYIWMDSYLCPSEDKDLFVANAEFQIEMMTDSTSTFSWNEFLDSALPVLNVNFYQSVMMLAGAIACFHYPYSIQIAGTFKLIGMRQKTLTTFINRAKIKNPTKSE